MPAAKAKGQRIRAEHVRAGTRSAARVAEFMGFENSLIPGKDAKLGSTKFDWWLENVAPPLKK
jgi:hypothetical protein